MADVFELLRTDHAEMKQMMAALQESPTRRENAAQNILQARGLVADRLVMEASRHEAAEEQFFWSAVREHVVGGDQLADVGLSQESRAKDMLATLDKLDPSKSADEFDRVLAQFIPVAQEHIEYEETQVWPKLSTVLSADDANRLGEQVRQAKERGPTRPHPRIPPDSGMQKVAGPVAALVDGLRDAISGRGGTARS